MTTQMKEYLLGEIGLQMAIPNKAITLIVKRDVPLRAHIAHVIVAGLSKPAETIIYPETWWEAVKERWFPRWLCRWFPVKRHIFIVKRFCPHKGVVDILPHQDFLDKPGTTELIDDGGTVTVLREG